MEIKCWICETPQYRPVTLYAATFRLHETRLHRGMHTYIKGENRSKTLQPEISVSLVRDSEQQEAQWPNITCSRRNSACSISRPEASQAFSSATKEGLDYVYPFSGHSQQFRPWGVATYRSRVVQFESQTSRSVFLICEKYSEIHMYFNVIIWGAVYV